MNLRRLKSCQASFQPQCYKTRSHYKGTIGKKHKYVEAEQHTKQPNASMKKSQRKNLETNENGSTGSNSFECSKSSTKREVYRDRGLPQETRKISDNLTLHLQELEKEQIPKLVEERK